MADAVVDTGFLVALLSVRDRHHDWARRVATEFVTPWYTCEAVLSEAAHILEPRGWPGLSGLVRRGALRLGISLSAEMDPVMTLMDKYEDLPIGLADACLVRMTELLSGATVITTDAHFRVYRRHSRLIVPCILPS